ncbi:MAG: Carbonic anhydrase, cadmium-binding protein [Candidatus Saccharibacteria bacterium]|nr:Carbonic anhydrase, cadmium-binding protein [Candidatus Saccharibacteria bacterium]
MSFEGVPQTEQFGELERPMFVVTRISHGFEFGTGEISARDEDPEVLGIVDDTIHNNPGILVPIDHDDNGEPIDDDGCGDGRGVAAVFSLGKVYKRSLNRPKVFGASPAMAAAILVGTGKTHNQQLNDVFSVAISELENAGLNFGAHTDEHASGKKCGCGAIDRAPEAYMAAVKYEEPIRNVIASLGVDMTEIDTVYKNMRAYVREVIPTQTDYSGKQVVDEIVQEAKVVKQLAGEHKERRIVLNQIPGYTVNQKLIRDVTNNRAQIFAVDTWRLQEIADRLAGDDEQLAQQALLSELVYTLAIAAVLTKGDLPVDMIQPVPQSVVA